MRTPHSGAALAILITVAGCGAAPRRTAPPSLQTEVLATHALAATTRCGQGPYELELSALGHRWGESIELRVDSPRAIQLRAELRVNGEVVSSNQYGERSDNHRCVISLDELHRTSASSVGDGVTSQAGEPHPGKAVEKRSHSTELIQVDRHSNGALVLRYDAANPTLEPPEWEPRTRLVLRWWSVTPNDLEDAVFVVRHLSHVPPKGDAHYVAALRAEAAARADARARAEAAARADARARAHARADARAREERESGESGWTAEQWAEWETKHRRLVRKREERERRRLRVARLERERAARREAYCKTHLSDRECWGPGGFRWVAVLKERAAERERYCHNHSSDARCWTQATWSERRRAWREDADQRKYRAPDGPPPAAKSEAKPPRPSDNAEWRPGYWHWTGREWSWLAGLWRVPQADIDEGRTMRTSQLPPPPRDETRPPPPAPHAVWVAGTWYWNGGSFVWVPGGWRLPPGPGVQWRAPRWERRGSISILVPGGWTR